ncbi:MAG: hypothetical protein JWP26_1817 [Devosia sp.]|uniref:hypothetical protein n=1 Tax=Devosia sp. TaxID=1871048 RepID=UPI00261B34C0|nr:hypothetical protein [Devosia sp.]MDB5586847.1 hypothetical protein [Devosia sp.]
MLWSKRLQILSFSAIALVGTPLLAACTLTPVYSGRLAENPNLELAFAAPTSRLDQVVIQELALRFGKSPTAPVATVSTSASGTTLVDTVTANPNKTYEVTVTATLTIEQNNDPKAKPLVLTRRATANYQTGAQILNDQSAYTEASERAAKSAAESLRLAILATLTR